jgi:hypothetical protein
MAVTRTLSIIKPDATNRNLTGKINAKFEEAGLRIVAQKRIHLTKAQAGKFYEVHAERPFYGELTDFMSSAPVVVQVLEGEDAVLARYARSSPCRWAKTRSTVRTRMRTPPSRSPISSPEPKSSADFEPDGVRADCADKTLPRVASLRRRRSCLRTRSDFKHSGFTLRFGNRVASMRWSMVYGSCSGEMCRI